MSPRPKARTCPRTPKAVASPTGAWAAGCAFSHIPEISVHGQVAGPPLSLRYEKKSAARVGGAGARIKR